MIELRDLTRRYRVAGRSVAALGGVTLSLPQGSFTAICGESGSGKSTLLGILGLMDRPNSGQYLLAGQATERLGDSEQSALRATTLGFLFQSFRLLGSQSILNNVILPMEIARWPGGRAVWRARAAELLEGVGLAEWASHVPAELSGGQMQRAAFARALAADPALLLADEPTGNLDAHNRDLVLELIADFHRRGKTVVVVTHDPAVAERADTRILLAGGRVAEVQAAPAHGR